MIDTYCHLTKKEELRMSETWLQEYIFLAFRLSTYPKEETGGISD